GAMSTPLPRIYLVRHGETEWSLSGQHTGVSDIPLTARGEDNARKIGERLRKQVFARVFTSPRRRARRTCELAGYDAMAEIAPDPPARVDSPVEEQYGPSPVWCLGPEGPPCGRESAARCRRLAG